MLLENKLRRAGFTFIAGVDEVGRGPLAGPIVAAAVILPAKFKLPGLNDSKKLSAPQREKLFGLIKKQALAIGLALVSHGEIDRLNIEQANRLVLKQAVENLTLVPQYLLIDGVRNRLDLAIPQKRLNDGDAKCASIAAASVIAKVSRDRMMVVYHEKFPRYGFARHKGYGTRAHLWALRQYGPCAIHRRSFTPVSSLV